VSGRGQQRDPTSFVTGIGRHLFAQCGMLQAFGL
jgi:hypothetical protein